MALKRKGIFQLTFRHHLKCVSIWVKRSGTRYAVLGDVHFILLYFLIL